MSFTLLNFNLASILSIIALIIITSFIYLSYKRNFKERFYFILFFRLIAILIIGITLLHPLLEIPKNSLDNKKINVYVDNSKSMGNNIILDSLSNIVNSIHDYGKKNNYEIDVYLFGDSVRPMNSNMDLRDSSSDLKKIKKFIINNNADQNIIISDGLNYLNASEYSSYQSINVIGVGLAGVDSNSSLSLKDAEIFDNILTYKIDFNNFDYDNLKINLRNSDSLIHFENFNLISKSGIYIDSLDVRNLNLSKYSELNIGVNIDDDNIFNNYVNVFQNNYNLKNISLITGIPSLNTKYVKEKLNYLNDNIYHVILEDDFDIDYDSSQLIVFDNYPNNISQMDEFNSTVIELKKNKIPFIMIFGPNQDYNIINKVSENFEFSILNEVETELVFNSDVIYNDSKLSQFMPPISYYKILSESQNLNNIYYSNFSPAILFENNSMFVFCPYLSQISYKLNDNKDSFDDLFELLFKQIYYQDEYVRLFTDRNNFYNYENIEIKLKDNSGIQYDDLLLKIKDSNNNLYAQYSVKEDNIDKYIVPPIEKAGTYYFYLLNNNQKVSNKLTVSIYNYDNEDILKGQNVEYLKKIASKTNGLYSNEDNFLANLKNNTINYKINYNKDIYDVKDYLLVLLIAILALIVDWYLRKKRGLL